MKKAVLFKIKEGKKDVWYAWTQRLQTELAQDAVETLKEERLLQESFVAFNLNEEDYTLGFIETVDDEPVEADKTKEINQLHTKYKKECLEPMREVPVEVLYSFLANK